MHSTKTPLHHDDVIKVVGSLDDDKVAAIIATGGTLDDLMEAFAWSAGETDALADAEKSLTGKVAEIYDILTADEQWWEREE